MFGCVYIGNSKMQWITERNAIGHNAIYVRASSEQTWDPRAEGAADFWSEQEHRTILGK
jgi:hypothetical protein